MDLDYHQLKAKAKELGLPYHKLTRAKLEESINTKLNNEEPPKGDGLPPVEAGDVTPKVPATTKQVSKKEATPASEEKYNREATLGERLLLDEDSNEDLPKNSTVYNAAIILKDSREFRRYTKENHGENFIDMATDFAAKKNYKVKLETITPAIRCPSCGHKIT